MTQFPLSDRELGRQARRQQEAELVQNSVPDILTGLLAGMLTVVRLCDRCVAEHFQPKPTLPHRDCLNVRCGCWCTTGETNESREAAN